MSKTFIAVHLELLPEGVYLATSDDLPGFLAQGRTLAETIEIAEDVARGLIESYLEHEGELPAQLRVTAAGGGDVRIPVILP